jgi:hypothetical protein
MKSLKFVSSTTAAPGYSASTLAQGEKNDCVVKAFAVAFEIRYDIAHKKVAEIFDRKPRCGTSLFSATMNSLSKKRKRINCRRLKSLASPETGMAYWVYDSKKKTYLRDMTTGTFIKSHPVGTYILAVKEHTFVVRNGAVIGNPEDAVQKKKVVLNAWQIIQ